MTETELKLIKVVLYKTGLGFFEKKGKIDLSIDKKIRISFKNSNMNDLLKTFSIMRTKGDLMVAGVSYEGQDTNSTKLLEDSIINLPESASLTSLISQLRGFQVNFKLDSGEFEGIIVGLQKREQPISDKSEQTIEQTYIMIKKETGSVRTLSIKDVREIEILDPIAKNDFKFFMDVVQSIKSEKFRNVTVFFQGKQKSEFILTFLQEIPAYKVSWRLYLQNEDNEKLDNEKLDNEKKDNKKEDKGKDEDSDIPVLLQGWAIIDNVLPEDWENVRLSLVSGLPVSFKYDSYSPLWISRPTVERGSNLSIEQSPTDDIHGYGKKDITMGRMLTPKEEKAGKSPQEIINDIVVGSNVKGGGYQYDIPMPVTVKQNQSSLIPIFQVKLNAKLVSVYNKNANPRSPMQTLEFKNKMNSVLEEGPISVYKDDIFQGEAVLPFMEKEEQQRIPYAINQSIEINWISKSNSLNYHEIAFSSSGFISAFYFHVIHQNYEIKNISDKSQNLIIEHFKIPRYELFETEEPTEQTNNFYRFKVNLEPNESRVFEVKERIVFSKSVSYEEINSQIIDEWLNLKLIDSKKHERLLRIIKILETKRQLSDKLNQMAEKQDLISKEQERIRENIKVLEKSESEKKLRDRYVAKFEVQESEFDGIEREKEQIKHKLDDLNQQEQEFRKNSSTN